MGRTRSGIDPFDNQTILAIAKDGIRQRDLYTPILVKGKVFVEAEETELAETSYRFEIEGIEDYEVDWIPPGHENFPMDEPLLGDLPLSLNPLSPSN